MCCSILASAASTSASILVSARCAAPRSPYHHSVAAIRTR
jgi:hypothetical protein